MVLVAESDGLVRVKTTFTKTSSKAGKEREMRKQKIMHLPFRLRPPVISE